MTANLPTISVCICTRNRADELIFALKSVLASDYGSFEVVVVDQSDDASTANVIGTCQQALGHCVSLRHIPTDTRGIGFARNIAIQESHGELIAFTDDDCIVPVDWVSNIARLFIQDASLSIAYGQVHIPDELLGRTDIVVPCLYFDKRRELLRGDIFGMTANMAFRKSVMAVIGGFDNVLGAGGPFGGGEDFDLVYRAELAAVKILAEPTMIVQHKSFRTHDRWRQVLYAYGRGDAAFYGKHARCGDNWAQSTIRKRFTTLFLKSLVNMLIGRIRSTKWSYLRGFLAGLHQSKATPIDSQRRLYKPLEKSPVA